MVKLTALFFIFIAPVIMGVMVVGVLAMSSPTVGGTPIAEQGMTILMVVLGAAIAALPISYVIAGMVNRKIGS
jgi:hypothetical protein